MPALTLKQLEAYRNHTDHLGKPVKTIDQWQRFGQERVHQPYAASSITSTGLF